MYNKKIERKTIPDIVKHWQGGCEKMIDKCDVCDPRICFVTFVNIYYNGKVYISKSVREVMGGFGIRFKKEDWIKVLWNLKIKE